MPASPASRTTWPSPSSGPLPAVEQQRQLVLAPDQRREYGRTVQGLEAALGRALADDGAGAHRLGEALEAPTRPRSR